jgi:hypothetical protein
MLLATTSGKEAVVANSVNAALAKSDLDREEARIKQLLARLEVETTQARQQLNDVLVARKVMERIHGEPAKPAVAPASGSPPVEEKTEAEPEKETPKQEGLTIKEAALRALKSAYPKGYQKLGVSYWIKKNLHQTVNSASLSVMLARLRDDDGTARNDGNIWFFVPEKDRKPAA